ncbi:hypothetical protein IHE45_17G093300 [Dioscorea alata]|uniref:Uncharacterized protein n=2 Tax=Dioscorea alata TaxID=55571 RepID=A0ACB7UDW3_DIOAL|nr:hypothetical protein IHE45_17G093300 [Dioscorea alata]KAH7658518.1 hypothetical protein IHE45_17G093300 [Dioscorea alata]
MEDIPSSKRQREDSDELPESPEVKRLRDDLFLDMLDDDVDAGDRDSTVQDLASVMKSLEEEIGLPAPAAVVEDVQPDLGFLLGASDDELGLPPAPVSSEEDGEDVDVVIGGLEAEGCVYGDQIWGFDDEIFDGGLGFGVRMEERDVAGDDGVLFDGGLFDYSDVVCGPSDLGDRSWRVESLPAV